MIKLLTLFAGYGGDKFALKKADIDYEEVGFSEIDKYATQCHLKNHKGESLGDVTKINEKELPDFDLLTGGFPCQSFSVAGKGLGEQDTRGTLFNEIIRIAEYKQPRYILLENVKGLVSKRHEKTFNKILSELDRIGYSVDWKILNSKEHGIPQNRERVWFACFRDAEDWEKWEGFPKKEELKIFLKDILEEEVDENYYLSEKQIKQLKFNLVNKNKWNCNPSGNGMNGNINTKNISNTISTNKGEGHKIVQLNRSKESNNQQPFMQNRVYLSFGISHAICSIQPNYLIKNATKKGYQEATPGDGINLEHPNSKTRRGRVQKQMCSTLQTNDQRGVLLNNLRIRKLTPKECFRLMGFLDDKINLDDLSNTQRYKLAGNGWEINVVSKIFKNMFKTSSNTDYKYKKFYDHINKHLKDNKIDGEVCCKICNKTFNEIVEDTSSNADFTK